MYFEQKYSQKQHQVQKLALTQQLQQSIQILQYNHEELREYLENVSLENPLIEVIERRTAPAGNGQTAQEIGDYLNQLSSEHDSLFEYILDQIHLNYRDTYLRALTIYLAEHLDSNGYLTTTLEDAAEKTGADEIQLLDALTLLQQLDPAGVGARNLQECLMLQTERKDDAPALAYIVLEENFDELVSRKWEQIAQTYHVSLPEIQEIFDFLQKLDPYPGMIYPTAEAAVIIPELFVKEKTGALQVASRKKGLTLNFQENYFAQLAAVADDATQDYLKEKKAQYQWLKKTLLQRSDTILLVGQYIVEQQAQFFLDPDRPLKPLALKDVAEKTGLHESTISRAVNGKYLETRFGVFELRSFFTHQSGKNNEDLSASEAKKKIAKLIENENKAKPLSDQKIVELLKKDAIELSRRTVAKYREALKIPSSSKRKRYDQTKVKV